MLMITPLTADELSLAYQIAQISFRHPCPLETFLGHHGPRYLNLKGIAEEILIGFAITQIIQDEASLLDLAIHPTARRRGYAQQLLLSLIQQLSNLSVNTLWLEVRLSNHPARELYQKLNFTEVFIRSSYYLSEKGREDAVVLAKQITE